MEGEDEVLELLARHSDKLGRRSSKDCSEDNVVPDTVMGDWADVSWGCVMK